MMEREVVFQFGPRFFAEGDDTMFEFRIDAGNCIGPRKATEADVKKHAKAWDAYVASHSIEPSPEEGDPAPAAENVPDPEPAPAPKPRGRPRKG